MKKMNCFLVMGWKDINCRPSVRGLVNSLEKLAIDSGSYASTAVRVCSRLTVSSAHYSFNLMVMLTLYPYRKPKDLPQEYSIRNFLCLHST